MLSFNQTMAQIKLAKCGRWEMSKVTQKKEKDRKCQKKEKNTRGNREGRWIEKGKTEKVFSSFMGDATRLCNRAPDNIKKAKTIGAVKKEIKKYCKLLPI